MRFDGRGVIVTGAAQGIGRGIAAAFLDEGAHVLAADVRADGLEATRSLAPDRVVPHVVDLADADAARGVVPAAIEALGEVHVLVNCAGVMPEGPFLDVTPSTFDLTFAVNVRAPMLTMQAVAPHLAGHGGGAIVNIASANAFKNESPEAPYNASKAALVALTKAAAHEWGHLGIRANCVAPGQTNTPEDDEVTQGRPRRGAAPTRVPAEDPAAACRDTPRSGDGRAVPGLGRRRVDHAGRPSSSTAGRSGAATGTTRPTPRRSPTDGFPPRRSRRRLSTACHPPTLILRSRRSRSTRSSRGPRQGGTARR